MIGLLTPEKIKTLLRTIAQKRELRQLAPAVIEQELERYLQQEGKVRRELEYNFHQRAAIFHTVVKEVRSRLRRSYGLFQHQHRGKEKKRMDLLQKLFQALKGHSSRTEVRSYSPFMSQSAGNKKRETLSSTLLTSPGTAMVILKEILESHASTKERLPFYRELYLKIFSVTGKPASILDLGCGLNPFSLPFMKLDSCKYYAFDIGTEDLRNINHFFSWWERRHHKFQGRAAMLDITRSDLSALPRTDLCFLFKVTDILDQGKGHTATEKVILAIPAKYIILSFSTITMSGRPMTAPQRRWVELLCKRLGFFSTVISFPTEIFYVIKKEK